MSEPSLHDLQRWVQSKIASSPPHQEAIAVNPWCGGSRVEAAGGGTPERLLNPQRGIAGETRLAVYAEGYVVRMREALHEVYEAIHQVLGERTFAELASAYARRYPSHESNLSLVGRHLPEFLTSWPLTQQLPFLPDLAQLEWRVSLAFHATQKPSIDPQRIASVSLDAWERTVLVFQPSVGFVSSAWPILDLWNARAQPRSAINIELVSRPQCVLIFRRALHLYCEAIDAAQALLLEQLLAGATLGAACDLLTQARQHESLPITAWFAHWMREGLIAGYV